MSAGHAARFAARGTAFVETLVAVPIVLLLGLGALQWSLLFHARTALEYALLEAARAGSVAQARPDAIEAGLARGLMPFWFGIDASSSWASSVAASNAQLRQGIAAGWVSWRQLAPTVESFGDWGEAARDAAGYPVASLVEIPNDSLQWASLRQPAGGVAGMRGDEPIGARSMQTLNDANLLKLELRYGVPMSVPLVGRIAVWVMRVADGCEAPSGRRLGTVDLGVPAPVGAPRAWACAIYLAPDAAGNPVPRWPVRASATVRMQSPARRSAMTPHRAQSPVFGAAAGRGTAGAGAEGPASTAGTTAPAGGVDNGIGGTDDESAIRGVGTVVQPASAAVDGPVAATADNDGSSSRADSGWLEIGGERTFWVPGACTWSIDDGRSAATRIV
ncbi:MAG: pilus assembly protein [Burkholderiaceae bacterium]|nr:pilus assembly protein [Burkholderiaceae bacterium]